VVVAIAVAAVIAVVGAFLLILLHKLERGKHGSFG
jgi:hypothetical protein